MSGETEATKALEARLSTMAGLPNVAWPNQDYKPEGDALHLEVAFLRNTPTRASLGSLHIWPGILQVTIVAPKGSATRTADEMAEAIADHFDTDLRLDVTGGGEVKVTQRPQIAGGFSDDVSWRVPVSVFFQYRA